ncbi:MAG: hypothetical protein M0Z40_02405 [Actinomycetota bacterium]|nr:hypothetical protein [Actinomycetota bacterium]
MQPLLARCPGERAGSASYSQVKLSAGATSCHHRDDSSGSAFDWLARRRDLVARRPLLPPGALVIEGGPLTLDERGELEDSDATSLGTFTVRAEVLEFSCLSAQRLDGAVALVERSLPRFVPLSYGA